MLAIDLQVAARRARLRPLLLDVEEHVGELRPWPHRDQALALLGRLPSSRGDIHRFILFHLRNRCPPAPLARLLLGGFLLNDRKAGRDAWDSMRYFRDGRLGVDAFYWTIDDHSRAAINAPDSWCAGGVPHGMRDPVFWVDAEHLLLGFRS